MIRRLVFLLPAGLAMLAGLDAALLLLGLPAPLTTDRLPDVHGMLLVLGFVGTVIALERSVALRSRAGFAAPALLGIGALVLLSPAPLRVGQFLLVAGCAALVGIYVPLFRRSYDDSVMIQALGAVLALGGALLWTAGVPMPDVLPWLAGFIVATIIGERLELARVIRLAPRTVNQLLALVVALMASVTATLLWPGPGYALLGATILALVAWLAVHDVARRTIRSTGLPRFMAGCLLAGYAWLAVAGGVWLLHGRTSEGFAYDAVIHSVFLGFTLSMIFAHAPVILPAVLRVRLPYHPVMIVPAALLHASLALRVLVGDARQIEWARQVGGVLNITALLLFVVITVASIVVASRRSPAASSARRPTTTPDSTAPDSTSPAAPITSPTAPTSRTVAP
ncbi:hypothetical protein SAMN05216410_2558 [Sanguibacter gelidistatuariae]|uniref:Uncharacterized protein n=1 Tax=Sanguibacter gelidistatuariae TaxID=1814289 RepID=A0A1G6QIM1_9MICO|nr:hypothetical protein [Sanguibacter gelidistatuariae]SDC92332.1 hypothetical protein SAMN05216410_2558 [Sanguibacter gelidistatuariae]